jgi:hypothetical protein
MRHAAVCVYICIPAPQARRQRRALILFSIRQHASACVSMRQHASACVSMRQHTSAYVSIRQHTSAYVWWLRRFHRLYGSRNGWAINRQVVRSISRNVNHETLFRRARFNFTSGWYDISSTKISFKKKIGWCRSSSSPFEDSVIMLLQWRELRWHSKSVGTASMHHFRS